MTTALKEEGGKGGEGSCERTAKEERGEGKLQVLQNEGKFLNAQSLSPLSSKNAIRF